MKLIFAPLPDLDAAPHSDDVPIFSAHYDGGKVEYFTVKRKLSPNIQLRYMRAVRRQGFAYASAELVETVLGSRAMDVLTAYDDLTDDDMRRVEALVSHYASGAADPLESPDGPDGSSGEASPSSGSSTTSTI